MRARSLAVGVALIAALGAIGVTLSERVRGGVTTILGGDVAPAGDASARDSSARDGAARDTAALDTGAPADTPAARLPHPEIMLGTWHHGDRRSRYGDSLVLVLEGNGTARAVERRWTLDDAGWHASRVRREGTWALRYRGTQRMDLCTQWTTPTETDDCERILLADDSTLSDTIIMQYAGRHWRKVAAPPD